MPRLNAQGTYELREDRLLSEFLARFFPTDRVITRVRLGSPPIPPGVLDLSAQELKLLKRFSRWADALIIRPTELILVEAEVLPSPGIVSTLQLYGRLLRQDTDFNEWSNLPLRLMLVWAFEDPVLARLAREQNIEVRIFQPAWVPAALRARYRLSPDKTRPTFTPEL